MLDNTDLEGMYIPLDHFLSKPGRKWCIIKIADYKSDISGLDTFHKVGDIIVITKTKVAAVYLKNKREHKRCYKVKPFNFVEEKT